MTFDDLPMIDFLRDQGGSDDLQLFPKDVLDFNIDMTFDFPDMYGLPGVFPDVQQNPSYPVVRLDGGEQSGNRSGYTTPGVRRSISLGTQAFKESTWLWTPAAADHGYAEQCNLSLPSENLSSETADIDVMFPLERLSQGARDGVLGMVLSTCEKSIYPRVVACFPSAELLTNLLHSFMNFHVRQEISWIHPATLNINEESPEFLGSLVSSGAALSRVPELRKLGFAIQEAVRLYLPKMVGSAHWRSKMALISSVRKRQPIYPKIAPAPSICALP